MRQVSRQAVGLTSWGMCLMVIATAGASTPGGPPGQCSVGPTTVSRLGYEFTERDTAHFRLMLRTDGNPTAVQIEMGDLLERTYQQFFAEFKRAGFQLSPAEQRLDWLVFDNAEVYLRFARVSEGVDPAYLESYYSVKNNQVVLLQAAAGFESAWGTAQHDAVRALGFLEPDAVDACAASEEGHGPGAFPALDVRRAVHEATHMLAFNSGLQKRGVMYPLWVSEGLAMSLEADSVAAIGRDRQNLRRLAQLRQAHEDGRLMPIAQFVALVQIPGSQAAANDLYAQAWGFFGFLLQNHPRELRDYLRSLGRADAGTRTPEAMLREFTAAFGPIERLEAAWLSHVTSMCSGQGATPGETRASPRPEISCE